MAWKFRPPMVLVAIVLLGLIALLATLQYQWVGRISEAERDRMKASLSARTTEFAEDFDRELTRAYLLFQLEVMDERDDRSERFAVRYDRWQASSRFPRLVKDFYVATRADSGVRLERFNANTRRLEAAEWPPSMADWRSQLVGAELTGAREPILIRRLPAPVWESVPALVVPSPMIVFSARTGTVDLKDAHQFAYSILAIDREYVMAEMLPALCRQYFGSTGGGNDYHVAVVSRSDGDVLFQSATSFHPTLDGPADAAVDLFEVRTQAFGTVAAEVHRFTALVRRTPPGAQGPQIAEMQERISVGPPGSVLVFQQNNPSAATSRGARQRSGSLQRLESVPVGPVPPRAVRGAGPRWRLILKHPAGSLDAAVSHVRRRNLIISSGVLLLLAASLVMITVSSQRAQRLARQQMEFVAAVSHELRTPLAVIRSAGENLADGVVHDEARIRKYGDLVRSEGRRLTEMVEQILEFAGIQSGQRGFALGPVPILPLLQNVVSASSALVHDARLTVAYDVPSEVPPVLGDEPALRRVFQNLIGNAIKYGERGGWIGLQARAAGREVRVTVSDRGIGIAASEHARIFEPFYRAPDASGAQIQGAGLGLSLVKRIVESHGGRVTLRSAPGQGSHFTVHLPAAAADRADSRPPISAAADHRG